MTTHNFSLDRLCMLLRWNWINSRRQTLRIGMILSAFLGVTYTYILRLVQRKYIYANDISRLPDMVGTFAIAGALRVLPLFLCAMGTLIFSNMETKPMREHYLMLPASHAEKYATRFIHILSAACSHLPSPWWWAMSYSLPSALSSIPASTIRACGT